MPDWDERVFLIVVILNALTAAVYFLWEALVVTTANERQSNTKERLFDNRRAFLLKTAVMLFCPVIGILFFLISYLMDKLLFWTAPDLEDVIRERLRKSASIGFNAQLRDKYDKDRNILSRVTVEDIRKFGMIPEFIGRLPVIFTLEGLTREMMVKILMEPRNAILKQYQKLLELDEVKLEFAEDALEAIAEKAMERDTGARALRSIIEEFMLDIMYEIPKDDNIGRVTITREYIEGTGGPVIDIRSNQILENPDHLKRIESRPVG